jgi:hypothetical protein
MKRFVLALSFCVAMVNDVTSIHALTPIYRSSQRYGGASAEVGNAIAVNAAGEVFIAGGFSGSVNFGAIPLVSLGGYDVFLAKYDANGTHLWSQRFGSTGNDVAQAVAVDNLGNVVVTGTFYGTVSFGGANLVTNGFDDIFLAKFNSGGTHQWSKGFGSSGFSEAGRSVAVSYQGDVFITGNFKNTANFGGSNLVATGLDDIFLAKFNAAGTHLWSKRFGSFGSDFGNSVGVTSLGAVYLTGDFEQLVNFGGADLMSAGSADIFLALFNGSGVHAWSKRFGGTLIDSGHGVAVDETDHAVVTGIFSGTADFGGGNVLSQNGDVFVAKYDIAGNYRWMQSGGSSYSDEGNAVAVDSWGNVYVTGDFQSTGSFAWYAPYIVSAGGSDAFILRYSANGKFHWGERFGGPSNDFGRAIDVSGTRDVVTFGEFQGTGTFGPAILSSAGGVDLFTVKYDRYPAELLITSITDIGNDQGGKVKILFDRSGMDESGASSLVTKYVAFRQIKSPPAALAAGSALAPGWTEVGSVGAFGEDAYSIDVPTIGDSTIAAGEYYSRFYIRAATNTTTVFYDAAADSGYSLDNLAPGVPSSFAYAVGQLSWNQSTATDFDFFTVYGSNTDSFGAATLVDYSVAPALDVSGSPYGYYYVTATDFSGNEGKPAKVHTLSGVGGTPRSYVLSVSNYPNPFNPRTTVNYTVPSRGHVTVRVFDARGAYVATLFDGERNAGAYSVDWDGRTDGAAVAASGVYFARIEHASGTRSKKMVMLK